MTIEEFAGLLDDGVTGEFLKFGRVTERFSNRPDLHAFILIDRLLPNDPVSPKAGNYSHDMISASEHDQFWLSVDAKVLAEVITKEQAIDLSRCGVCFDEDDDTLYFFT